MSEAVLAVLITGAVSLMGSALTAVSSGRLTAYKMDELKQDFADLRERVNKHNSLVERVTIVEQSVKSAHHRIDDMKGGH